jgi:hypothetical protein
MARRLWKALTTETTFALFRITHEMVPYLDNYQGPPRLRIKFVAGKYKFRHKIPYWWHDISPERSFWIGTSVVSFRYYSVDTSPKDIFSVQGKDIGCGLDLGVPPKAVVCDYLLFDFKEMRAMDYKRRMYDLKNFGIKMRKDQ